MDSRVLSRLVLIQHQGDILIGPDVLADVALRRVLDDINAPRGEVLFSPASNGPIRNCHDLK